MIPEGWKETNIAAVIDGSIKNGYSPNPVENVTGFYVLSLGALGEDKSNFTEYKNIVEEPHIHEFILKYGDFLISRSNTPDKVGRAGLYLGEDSNIIYPDLMMRFRVNEDLIDKIFFIYYLKFSKTRTYFQQHAAGSSKSMVKINKNTVLSTPILLPPLAEQKKIAEILSTWDEAISVVDKQLENCRLQKKAFMQQLLTGKKRLPGFSGEWKKYSIGYLLYEADGAIPWSDEEYYNLLSVKRRSEGVVLREILQGKSILTKKMNKVSRGDFVISKMQVVHGAWGMVPACYDKHHVSDSYIILRPKDTNTLSIPFFDYFCSQKVMYHKALQSSYGVHIEKMTFNLDLFMQEKICIPSDINEQKAIYSLLACHDQKLSILEKKKNALQEEKKSLMQQLLTGKKRVAVEE